MHNSTDKRKIELIWIFAMIAFAIVSAAIVSSAPSGPSITVISNETKAASAVRFINTTGGSITTIKLNATSQNYRWKAYVGNVSGTMVLDDANDNTLFRWDLAAISGEVYATRSSSPINWSGTNCSNSTHISMEEYAMNHTSKDDNITKTFNSQTHSGFYVGVRQILASTCYSVHTYVNSTAQTTRFEEVVLYDGTNETNGNIIYAAPLEQDRYGFDNQTYDFQMIVPENGAPGFSGSTAYYFYVELS